MLCLDLTTKKLEFLLGAAHTTNALTAAVFYYQVPRSTRQAYMDFNKGSTFTTSNGTSAVTLLAAPTNPNVYVLDHIAIHNKDTVTQTVTVQVDVSATDYILVKVDLLTKETLIYENGNGWQVI